MKITITNTLILQVIGGAIVIILFIGSLVSCTKDLNHDQECGRIRLQELLECDTETCKEKAQIRSQICTQEVNY